MIILADSPNSKGAQLEALTLRLLRHRSYENCTTNVMTNGAEIDVRGELPLAGLGHTRRQQLICECKAHKAVIDMTQWCKFLGKVFHQETVTEAEVAGCFISLSGVNGHVQGHYDEFRRHSDRISLLHGDELLQHIAEIIPFVSLQDIGRRVASMTPRTVSRFEPAYHNGAIFWIVMFSAGEFSIFAANGQTINEEIAIQLAPMIESELDVSTYIDIQAEVQAQQRVQMARTLVVATMFNANGSIDSLESIPQIEDFSQEELVDAAQQLINEGHLILGDDGRCIVPVTPTAQGDLISLDLYRVLVRTAFPTRVLEADFYQRHINRALLDEVCTVQCGLPLRDADVEELIELLRLSPSALAQTLYPMQMIVTARQHDPAHQDVDRFHQDYFRQAALQAFKRDFQNRALAEFYHDNRGLKELETTTVLVLKSGSTILSRAEFTERVGIGRAAESLGGGVVHVAMLPDAPQPWEIQQHIASADVSDANVTETESSDDGTPDMVDAGNDT